MNAMRLIGHSAGMMSRHKLRTGFMMVGSLVGVAALTLVISVGQAAKQKMLIMARQVFGDASVMVMDGGGHMMGGPRNPGTRLNLDDIQIIANQVPGIETWDPQQGLTATVRRGDGTDTAQVLGVSERFEGAWGRTASRGALFDTAAVKSSARVAIV